MPLGNRSSGTTGDFDDSDRAKEHDTRILITLLRL